MRSFISILILTLSIAIISCDNFLEVPDISGENVKLLAPSDSVTVRQSDVTFSWNEVFEATQYQMQVASPNFEKATQIIVDTLIVVDSTFGSFRVNKTLVDSEYEWRVKAMNNAYETEFSVNQFKIETSQN